MKRIVLLLFLLMPITVHAKESFSITCDQNVLKEFSDFECRLAVKSDNYFNKIEFTIETSEGVSLEDVRSNYKTLWNIKTKNQLSIASTVNSRLVSGTQEFGILLFETMGSGDQSINIKNITLSGEKTISLKDVTEKITILSSENQLKGIFINNESIPNFISSVSSYKIEIANDITELQLDAIAINAMASIEGTGKIELDLNQKEFVIPINVKSASGTNKAYFITFKRKDAPTLDITANNIALYNGDEMISFKFDPYIYEYNIEVPDNVESLDIEAGVNSVFSLVKKYGSRTVNIVDGDNLFFIKVKDASGQVKTYTLNITRVLSNKSANYYLKDLSIKGYNLKFNKRIKQYELAIKKNTSKLDISAVADYKNSNVTILGNDNLKENSVIKIIVTAENGSKLTYQIIIKYKPFNYSLFILLIIILSVSIVYYDWRKKKSPNIKLPQLLLVKPKVDEAAKVITQNKENRTVVKAVTRERITNNKKTNNKLKVTPKVTNKKRQTSSTSKNKNNNKKRVTHNKKAAKNKSLKNKK